MEIKIREYFSNCLRGGDYIFSPLCSLWSSSGIVAAGKPEGFKICCCIQESMVEEGTQHSNFCRKLLTNIGKNLVWIILQITENTITEDSFISNKDLPCCFSFWVNAALFCWNSSVNAFPKRPLWQTSISHKTASGGVLQDIKCMH